MCQGHPVGRRRVAFGPTQRPFQARSRRGPRIQPAAQPRHRLQGRIGGARPQDPCQRRVGIDPVDQRQLAAQVAAQGLAVAAKRRVAHDLGAIAGAAHPGHRREGRADDRGVIAEAQGFGHAHARAVGRGDDRIFLCPRPAGGDGRGSVAPDHQVARHPVRRDRHRPILLDRAARQLVRGGDPRAGQVQRRRQPGVKCGVIRQAHAPQPQKSSPSRA